MIHRLHLAWHRLQEWRFIRHAERMTGLKVGPNRHRTDLVLKDGKWYTGETVERIANYLTSPNRVSGLNLNSRTQALHTAVEILELFEEKPS